MKRFALLLLAALLFTLVLSACGGSAPECEDSIGCVEIAEGEPIRLAYMLTISGATAFLGEDSRGGIQIAIELSLQPGK